MRILHVNEQHDKVKSGVSTAANSVISQVVASGGAAKLIAVGDIGLPPRDAPAESVPLAGGRLGSSWRWGERLPARMRNAIQEFNADVVHLHGIWMAPQIIAARAAAAKHIPALLTNHGMLEPWSLAQPGVLGALKKSGYLVSVARWGLRDLALFHAITPLERDSLSKLFPGRRIEIIPNSIELDAAVPGPRPPNLPEDYILFVGRLHPKKGVDLLIEAFKTAHLPAGVKLLIAGPEDGAGYLSALHQSAADEISSGRILFLGPIWDDSVKLSIMKYARLVAVPSHSEVVALVNLEAGAVCTPTMTTRETGLLDWEDGGGILVKRNASAIARALEQAATWSDTERFDRGAASRRLVEQRYSTLATGRMWNDLYQDLAGRR